jgi:serine/threonine protein kinase
MTSTRLEFENYLILKQIGFGSTSAVHIAKHIQTQEIICVKIMAKKLLPTQKEHEHLFSELKILQSIRHINMVKFIDFIELPDCYCLFIEYIKIKTSSNLFY